MSRHFYRRIPKVSIVSLLIRPGAVCRIRLLKISCAAIRDYWYIQAATRRVCCAISNLCSQSIPSLRFTRSICFRLPLIFSRLWYSRNQSRLSLLGPSAQLAFQELLIFWRGKLLLAHIYSIIIPIRAAHVSAPYWVDFPQARWKAALFRSQAHSL